MAYPAALQRPDCLEIVVEQKLRKFDGEGGSGSMTIFRVPARVREANKELYEPRLVSIGPYYRGREALRAMEQHKWRYLRELLDEFPLASLVDFVRAVRRVEQRARGCYSEKTAIFDDDAKCERPGASSREISDRQPAQLVRRCNSEGNMFNANLRSGGMTTGDGGLPGKVDPCLYPFAEMLLLDGCFILQFFFKWHDAVPDELCDVGWGPTLLRSDLLLLENQIPFFVLEALLNVVAPYATRPDLLKLIVPKLKFLDSNPPKELWTQKPTPEIHHLLHLFHEAFVAGATPGAGGVESPPSPTTTSPAANGGATPGAGGASAPSIPTAAHVLSSEQHRVIPCISQLREAGIQFRKKASPRHMLDVTFNKAKGVVEMAHMVIDHANKPLLVNLVAFEQSRGLQRGKPMPLTSYTALLSCLVRTGKDVERLQKRGILDNLLDNDDDAAASFFQHLGDCSSLDYEEQLFAAMFADLNQYYHSSCRRQWAKFVREHCSSPCSVLALAVAMLAFAFSIFTFGVSIYKLIHHI